MGGVQHVFDVGVACGASIDQGEGFDADRLRGLDVVARSALHGSAQRLDSRTDTSIDTFLDDGLNACFKCGSRSYTSGEL
ncbi:hypothetical protein D3C85_1419250 [compost metagenome]